MGKRPGVGYYGNVERYMIRVVLHIILAGAFGRGVTGVRQCKGQGGESTPAGAWLTTCQILTSCFPLAASLV
eukprot:1138161-Pelagomonas_calceolata.AAC.8